MKELPREDSTDDGKVTAKKKEVLKNRGKLYLETLERMLGYKLNALSLQGTSTSILISRQN